MEGCSSPAAGRLLAVDPGSGRRLASRPVEGIRLLAAAPGAVFVSGGGSVRAFDGDLEPLWRRWLGTGLAAAPVLMDGRLWCAAENGFLYAIDPRRGELLWSLDLEGEPTGAPVPAAPGAVVATAEGELIGVGAGGRVLWRQRLAAGPAAAAAGGDRLYAAGDGRLHAFAPAAIRGEPGDTLWWESRAGGRKTGYGWRLWREEGDSLRLSEYAAGWRHGFVEARGESVLDAGDLSVRRVSRTRADASQELRTEVSASGAGLLVERRLGPGSEGWTVPDPGGVTLAAAVARRLARRPLLAGRRDTILVLDPESGVVRPVYTRAGTTAAGETPVTLRFGPRGLAAAARGRGPARGPAAGAGGPPCGWTSPAARSAPAPRPWGRRSAASTRGKPSPGAGPSPGSACASTARSPGRGGWTACGSACPRPWETRGASSSSTGGRACRRSLRGRS